MHKLFILLTLVTAIGCQSPKDKTSVTDSVSANKTNEESPIAIGGCYMEVLKRDTFTANLQQHGNAITGRLVFNNFEKDDSNGKVTGILEANTLKLSYSFSSEGMNSVMEVYFKYKNGNLIRGVGEIGNKADSVFFIDKAAVVFEGSILKKIPCESMPVKYQ